MRLHHLLVGLAVIFISIIAVEGLPQSASPTPYPSSSPQAVESPAKKQPAKKKGWWEAKNVIGEWTRRYCALSVIRNFKF